LFTACFELEKFVGIDICPPVEAFDAFCARHPIGRKIKTHYGVSQADKERVEAIVRDEFGSTPIDLIVDDASHGYALTRRAFEIAFPQLRPGGCYVIEDWGWAHWQGSRMYAGETALSMLIMELTMLCASRSDIISEVRVLPAFVLIRKSADAPPLGDMKLDALYTKRGIELVGARHSNLGGVARLMLQQVGYRARRKLARLTNGKVKLV
jgi:SAM-dependent methyltransferase